jgi:hypothetical protein
LEKNGPAGCLELPRDARASRLHLHPSVRRELRPFDRHWTSREALRRWLQKEGHSKDDSRYVCDAVGHAVRA